ncbi:outer membrane protein transport protein [Polynucleobacter sp. MWH-Spelu-300-X4]|uniref:OmpP1/FadL family transporter n=1 Tax=Polynucleobacter sp. MWH-Spelu-300-X4 TaxID=2689109 RepID=UPI001BFD41A4|nr:outer membrane protein transport protein [Polynucleobacter sp. MWH-Spelu-300-X4]QWD79882.1 outer membrane protein transport protein [Polynucleobacter sp. MWH-Spelu-300-X4]
MKLKPLVLAIALSGVSTASFSAGFQVFQQNASGLGNAYAGSAAVADNASTVFYNPAGMTELKGNHVSVGLNVTDASIKFTNGSSSVSGLASAGNGGNAGTTPLIPNGYFTSQIDEKLTFGMGIGAPFGSHSKYDGAWVGGAQALEFNIKTINLNPSIAYKLNEVVSLGFGLNFQKLDADYKRITGTITTYPVAVGNSTFYANLTTGLTHMDLSDNSSYGWNAGALFKLDDRTKIGISYRSAIKHSLSGSLTTSGVSSTTPGIGGAVDATGTGPGSANVKLPDMAFLSVVHKYNDTVEILGDVSWTGWSSIPKIDVYNLASSSLAQTLVTDFKDSWRFALGANYQYASNLKLKAGVAYDKTPVKSPDTRLVSLPDNDRTWLTVGTQWKYDKDSVVDIGLARVFIKNSDVNNDQRPARGLVNGSYKSSAWLFGLQYSRAF